MVQSGEVVDPCVICRKRERFYIRTQDQILVRMKTCKICNTEVGV